jgi:hypothetical protein
MLPGHLHSGPMETVVGTKLELGSDINNIRNLKSQQYYLTVLCRVIPYRYEHEAMNHGVNDSGRLDKPLWPSRPHRLHLPL